MFGQNRQAETPATHGVSFPMTIRWAGLMALLLMALPAFAQTAAPLTVVTLPSVAETHARTLILRGRTEAERRADLRAEVAGLVVSDPVRRGAIVARGDVLCKLAAGEREADLAEARAGLAQAELDVAAVDRLAERGLTSQAEQLARQARLEAARARLHRAELALERLEITAPFDGVLEDDSAEQGTLLQVGGHCATVIALDPILLVGFAPERTVDAIALGSAATARLVSGRRVEGTVRFVARTAEPETRTFRVDVALENPDLAIRDGISAEIEIRLDGAMAHRLPQSALTLDNSGALGIRIVENGRVGFVPVAIIEDTAGGVWVTGLPDEAEVIVIGQEFVSEGATVTTTRLAAPAAGAL